MDFTLLRSLISRYPDAVVAMEPRSGKRAEWTGGGDGSVGINGQITTTHNAPLSAPPSHRHDRPEMEGRRLQKESGGCGFRRTPML
ncbi:hypothetical protein EYF80_051913 [Liparis tanakae]|uniref:Uncharacterized protein n=1 Tax=Liparis tanakae TaxID=230148 RepID=A0A4Z2F9L0_9TELE|nr:hypothetical protein EYF80_051913 [Liparis tanakae]